MSVKPCPFCGGVIVKTNYKHPSGTVAVYCDACGAGFVRSGENALNDAHAAWNTRAERTCKLELPTFNGFPIVNGQPHCSACKAEFAVGTFPNYCPNCGAKVVEQ